MKKSDQQPAPGANRKTKAKKSPKHKKRVKPSADFKIIGPFDAWKPTFLD